MIRVLALLMAFGFTGFAVQAEDKPKTEEVTLTGDIACAKCALKQTKACHAALVVKKDGKEEVYMFDEKASKKYHGDICQETKPGTVKGTVEKKDGKMVITVKSLEYAK